MKILHVVDKLDFGGTQRLLKDVFENNKSKNIQHHLVALRKVETNFQINTNNITVLPESFKYNPFTFFKVHKVISKKEFQYIHLHLVRSIIFGLVSALLAGSRKKFIIHEHGAIFRQSKLSPYSLIIRFLSSKVSKVLAVSEATKKELIDKCKIPENKILVLYNPVNPARFKNFKQARIRKLKQKLNISSSFVIGYVGRLHKIKGVIYLLKAAQILREQHPQIKVLIVGDGPERENLENYVSKNNLREIVTFAGFQEEVGLYLNLYDVAVIPSLSESSGIVAFEFMYYGIPIVASKVGGLAEILEDKKTALFSEPRKANVLASKILEIIENRNLRTKLIENGKKYVRNFYIDKYIDRLNKLYSSL